MSNRMRVSDVPLGTIVIVPHTGRPFEVTFNGYTSDGNFASGWRTLRGTDQETGEQVSHTDFWECTVAVARADTIEEAAVERAEQTGAAETADAVRGTCVGGGLTAQPAQQDGSSPAERSDVDTAGDRGYRNLIVEPSGEVQHRAIAAWENVMRARTAQEAYAVVDELDEATLRRTCQRMDLPYIETPAAMREQVAAAVEERTEDLQLYEGQPFDDLTGVPDDVGQRACSCDGCGGTLQPVAGTQHFDADGGALVDTECDRGCGIASFGSWVWSRHEAPACDPTYYPEDDGDEDDRDEVDDSDGDEATDAAYIHPELAERYPWLTEMVVRDFGIPVGPAAAAEAPPSERAATATATVADALGGPDADDGHDDTDGM